MTKNRFMNFFLWLTVSIISMASAGCANEGRYGWRKLGEPLDSLNSVLDTLYLASGSPGAFRNTLTEFESAAATTANPHAAARAAYWKAVAGYMSATGSARGNTGYAKSLTDSIADPYMTARLDYLGVSDIHDPLMRYSTLKGLLDFFNRAGDDWMSMRIYLSIGSLFLSLKDLEKYRDCTRQVEKICTRTGADSLIIKNRMNLALYHHLKGNDDSAATVVAPLLEEAAIRKDSDALARLYINLAQISRDPAYYRKAIETGKRFQENPDYRHSIELSMAVMYESLGDYRRCDSIIDRISSIVMQHGDAEARMKIHAILSRRSRETGDYASALKMMEKSNLYRDSIPGNGQKEEMEDFIHRQEINNLDLEHARQKKLLGAQAFGAVATILLVAVVILFYFRERQTRAAKAKLKADAEIAKLNLTLETKRRSMVAMKMAMEERDNLVSEVSQLLDDMCSNGNLQPEIKKMVEQKIRMSDASRDRLADFKGICDNVHPEFMRRFTSRYPGVSEGDIRMALYIACGLTGKDIAQVMHLMPESVKKNRYRLRRRMGLSTEESLEQTLRALL